MEIGNIQNEKHYKLTRKEAEKLIKGAKAGAQFNVSLRVDLRIEGDDSHVYQDGGATHVPVSKSEALRIALCLLSETMEREKGARLPMRIYERESWKSRYGSRLITVYWIG